MLLTKVYSGLPRWCSGKEPARQYRRRKRCRFDPWVGTIPWRRARQPTPVILPGESHGQRSLAGYCPWGCKEADMAGSDKDACTKDIQVKKSLNSDKERRGKHKRGGATGRGSSWVSLGVQTLLYCLLAWRLWTFYATSLILLFFIQYEPAIHLLGTLTTKNTTGL